MNFIQYYSIFKHHSALIINIKLCSWLFLTIFQRHICLLILLHVSHVEDRNEFGLITAGPNNDISINKIWSLLFYGLSLYKPEALLLAVSNVFIQFLGVTSKPCKRVQVSLLISKIALFKVGVTICLGIGYFFVKYFNIVTVKNGYWFNFCIKIKRFTICKIFEFFIWFPIVIREKTKTFAYARFTLKLRFLNLGLTFYISNLTWLVKTCSKSTSYSSFLAKIRWISTSFRAMTAYFAAIDVLTLTTRGFRVGAEYFILTFRGILRGALMKHEPRTTKTRVRSPHYQYLLFGCSSTSSNLFHCLDITFPLEKIIRSNDLLRRFSQLRKPIKELRMDHLLSTICHDDIFSSEVNSFFCFRNPNLRGAQVLDENFTES